MSVLKPGKMVYKNFGNSGLKISIISMGNMINYKPETYQEDKRIIQLCLENGINHFDTAEIYAAGEAELQLGKILQELKVPREDVVIATKVHTAKDADMNSARGTNRKHIKESVKKSLERLQMDYVDILYAHLHDYTTPLEEICRAFHEVVEDGQAFYWGTSNWEPEVVLKAIGICDKYKLHRPIGAQNQYNMLVRDDMEIDYTGLFTKYNYGLIAWSPLAGGILTGKYLNGIPEHEVARFNDGSFFFPLELGKKLFYEPLATQNTVKKLQDLSALAESIGCKLTHLAIAWVMKYEHTDSALIGARTVAQLQDSLKALEVLEKLTPELEGKINKIMGTNPSPRMNFLTWTPNSPSRPIAE